jgi:hypothetical protein
MTKGEWTKNAALYQAFWPRATLPDATIGAWYIVLSEYTATDVRDAITSLAEESTNPPAVSEILGAIKSAQHALWLAGRAKERQIEEEERRRKAQPVVDQYRRLRSGESA